MARTDFVNATLALIPQHTSAFFTIVLVLGVSYLIFGLLAPTIHKLFSQETGANVTSFKLNDCEETIRFNTEETEETTRFNTEETEGTKDLSRPKEAFNILYETTEPRFISGSTLQNSPGGHGLAFPSWISPPLDFVVCIIQPDYDIMNIKVTEVVAETGDLNEVVLEDGIKFEWKLSKADFPNKTKLQDFLEHMRHEAGLVVYDQIDHLRFDRAKTTLQAMKMKLWASFKDTPLALWIEVHLAHVLLRVALMNVDNAQVMFDEALLTLNRCLGDMRYGDGWEYLNRLYCSAYLGRAWYYLIHGFLDKAKQDVEECKRVRLDIDDFILGVKIQVHWVMAAIHLSAGDLKKANTSWHDMGYRFESTRSVVNEAQRVPLEIHMARSSGELETALSICARSVLTEESIVENEGPILEEPRERLQRTCMGVIGDVWFALGACREADKYYEMAVGSKEASKRGMSEDFILRAAGLVGRANVCMRLHKDRTKEHLKDAKDGYIESLSIYKRLGHTEGQMIVHCNLGTLLVAQATQVDQAEAQKLFDQALNHYRQAKEFGKLRPAIIVELDCKIGQVYLAKGELKEAISMLENGRKSGQTGQEPEPLARAWIEHQLGHCLMKRSENERGIVKAGSLRSAEDHLISAIKSFASIKLSTRGTEPRFERLWFTMFEEQKETYALLQWCLACQRRPSDVVVWGERGRSQALIRDKWEDVRNSVGGIPQGNNEWMENLHPEKFDDLSCEHAWQLLQRWTSLCELCDTAIVQYTICKGFGLLISVLDGSSKPSVHRKSFAELANESSIRNVEDLEQLVVETVDGIRQNDSTSSAGHNQKLIKLSNLLLLPIEDGLSKNITQLIIIPHEHLHRVPFPALYCREQRISKKPRQHLIVKYVLSYADSIRSLIRCSILYKSKLHCFPRLTNSAPLIVGIKDHKSVNMETLINAEHEAKVIKSLCSKRWPKDDIQLALGLKATKDFVRKRLAEAQLVHFATHAVITHAYEEGGVVFAKPPEAKFSEGTSQESLDPALSRDEARSYSSDVYRGLHLRTVEGYELEKQIVLSADEISGLKLSARLVVLSACQTGRGVIAGEGVAGLGRALTRAGVPCAILSLWNVRDGATKELMKALYRNLIKDGMSVATALRKAMVDMILEKSVKTPGANRWEVEHWAAFQTYGLPSVCI